MRAISETLFHFLDKNNKDHIEYQLETFKKIMDLGLKFSETKLKNIPFAIVKAKCICFTDLPLNLSEQHVKEYGKFGIGFKHEFIKDKGGNPAFYYDNVFSVSDGSNRGTFKGCLTDDIYKLMDLAVLFDDPDHSAKELAKIKENPIIYKILKDNFANPLDQILANTTKIGEKEDKEKEEIYYGEREWRILCWKLFSGELNYTTKIVNEKEEPFLEFSLNDIRIIIIPQEDIRKNVISILEEKKRKEDGNNPSEEIVIPPVISYDEYLKL